MSFLIYKQRFNLYRLVTDSADSDIEGYQIVATNLQLNIQPAGLEYTATLPDGAMGKTYKAFTTYSGCQIGMRLVAVAGATVSGMTYEVTGVEDFSGALGRHYELLLRKSTK